MSPPRQRMHPWRQRRKPMSARSRVVFPTPFRPMITTRSATPTRSDTPFRTGTCPYRAWRPSTSSMLAFPQVDVADDVIRADLRSEEHTSELQSRFDLVCRLLLEKKNRE